MLADLLADTQPDPGALRRRAQLLGADLDAAHTAVLPSRSAWKIAG